jgi:hypothetical protein
MAFASVRARARAKTLEERLAAIGELVDGLGVARPSPHPPRGVEETEAASALPRPPASPQPRSP